MTVLQRYEQLRSRQLGFYFALGFVGALPFERFYSELFLVGFALHTLLHLRTANRAGISPRHILILQSVFLLTVVSTLWSGQVGQAFSFWTRQLAILLFPLLFAIGNIDPKRWQKPLLLALTISCAGALLYCYVSAVRVLLFFQLPWRELFTARFLNHNFSEPIGLHATYFSMYAALSALFLLSLLVKQRRMGARLLITIALLILMSGLLQLGSRAILIAVVVIGVVVFPVMRLYGRNRKRYVLFAGAALLATTLFAVRTPALHERLFVDLQSDLAREKGEPMLGSRAERWTLALELIRERPLTGWGAGDEVYQLKQLYFERGLYSAYLHDLNAHNQYLGLAVRSGIGGTLVYLFTLGYGLFIALRRKLLVFTGFLIIIAITSLSENILDVNKGIFFYAFFFSLFLLGEKVERRKGFGQPPCAPSRFY